MAVVKVAFSQSHVLLDIEGTMCSISYVKDVVFGYIRSNLQKHVDSNWNTDEFQSDLALLRKQCEEDVANNVEGVVRIANADDDDESIGAGSVVDNVLWQMNHDRKTTALKVLQAHIMKNAFTSGELTAHMYTDVKPMLESWKQSGKTLSIYSSGSIEAQKLHFSHTIFGNILHMFSNHFDTTIGSKTHPQSYKNIAQSLRCRESDIIFLTDVIEEAEAASKAGCKVVITVRPGNKPLTDDQMIKFDCIESFDQLMNVD